MSYNKNTAVLLFTCKDKPGLVSKISHFIFEHGGNIIDLDEYVDKEEQVFSIRIAWDMQDSNIGQESVLRGFEKLSSEFNADWYMHFLDRKQSVAIFVSKYEHCLQEILWRYSSGEYYMDIPIIISNHPDLQYLADQYDIPFYLFPITPETKQSQEEKEIELLKENHIDSIVMARYMQILTPRIISEFPNRIINIHHSFLPAFIGGNPYRQAFERGVKIIGATSHYATEDLDEGPIIEQDIIRISHKDSIDDLKRKGRDLERLVLARAVRYHVEHRILVRGKKTIVFD